MGKDTVLADYGNATFSKFKEALAELATAKLTPIGEEMRRLMADPVEIDRILANGAARAHDIADPILAKTKDIIGFVRS
jgi:tryptophanyl-tRNA synthetase